MRFANPLCSSLRSVCFRLLLLVAWAAPVPFAVANDPVVGVSRIDITPDYPVRLSGFGFRRAESEGVTQRIFAKALAIRGADGSPCVLVTADNLCVPDWITQDVGRRLAKAGVKPGNLTVTATHTHTAPMLQNVAPALFGTPIPPDHQDRIDRYTREFTDSLEEVALAAIRDMRPAKLSWAQGRARFAVNRRTPGGPVDHDLPVLTVRNPDGSVRAVWFSYACHCVTLSDNRISGDWAGFAQEAVERMFPGSVALASVGCGADANPSSGVTGDNVAVCAAQGREIAEEIGRLLSQPGRELTEPPVVRNARIDVPFDTPHPREVWEERAKADDAAGYHARRNLQRLDRGEALPDKINYPLQAWHFGDRLAVIFLPGETVVDYSLRLKREFDRTRIWVNGYSNDGRCYLPSERILQEGGYEGGGAMVYYDMPQRFAPGLEQRILDAVHSLVPASFAPPESTEGTQPLPPDEALRSLRTKPDVVAELVAAEPMVADPVAIDWDAQGRLWVCEMHDYPAGLDGQWQPGGRIRVLEDTDGNGFPDKSTVFLGNVPFPTGITVWGAGVLICAAPDVLFARDTDGDGRADDVRTILTDFCTDNFQARVNSLVLGNDNWLYGAGGLLGSEVRAVARLAANREPDEIRGPVVDIRNRDFRFHPESGALEPATGLTQQGRVMDDRGNWFGCDNSRLVLHYGLPEHYARRNPLVSLPDPVTHLTGGPGRNVLFPVSPLLERYNDFDHANRVTSACGLEFWRDPAAGPYANQAFVCEVVHNIVHREVVTGDGVSFAAARAPDEQETEFLASTDNWFRPAQVRTGPDGALYVVDMYRFLIEQPRWIPATRLAKLDVRAGADRGRIYRLRVKGTQLREVRDLTKLDAAGLAEALNSPNGTERARVRVELMTRGDRAAVPVLERLASGADSEAVRLQALCALDSLKALRPEVVQTALRDPSGAVRREAVRLAEAFLPESGAGLLSRLGDPDRAVRYQLALTLGEWTDGRAGQALAGLAAEFPDDPDLRTAVLTSARSCAADLLDAVAATGDIAAHWLAPLAATAAGSKDPGARARALAAVTGFRGQPATRYQALSRWLEVASEGSGSLADALDAELRPFSERLAETLREAARVVASENAEPLRVAAASLAGWSEDVPETLPVLLGQLNEATPAVRDAVMASLRRFRSDEVAGGILSRWTEFVPSVREDLAGLLLSRDSWAIAMLRAAGEGIVESGEIPLVHRRRLQEHGNPELRKLAAAVLPETARVSGEVIRRYTAAAARGGNAERGRDVFVSHCSTCHRLGGEGAEVGPDLEPLRVRDAAYWLQNILDPNAVVEPRYVTYQVTLADGRALAGVIRSGSASGFTVVMPAGLSETVLRAHAREIRALPVSLMPEGFDQTISEEEMSDLLAYVTADRAAPQPERPPEDPEKDLPRDPEGIARLILDPGRGDAVREAAIQANPQYAAALIREMTRDLTPGTPEEYVRIPWIWRVAVACGRRNDASQMRQVLDASLPRPDEPLHDWQTVVVGGGIINGIGLREVQPGPRIAAILEGHPELIARWQRALDLSAPMADDGSVPTGTRYDALRMLGVEPWEKRGRHLLQYLREGTHAELQMGAVSGLVDNGHPEALRALAEALRYLTGENRRLAFEGILRSGAGPLLDRIQEGTIPAAGFSEEEKDRLRSHSDPAIRSRAAELLPRK